MGGNLAAVDLGENTAQEVAAGQSHTCVLLTSGDVACFGFNLYGQVSVTVANTWFRLQHPHFVMEECRSMAEKSCIASTVEFIKSGSKVFRNRSCWIR